MKNRYGTKLKLKDVMKDTLRNVLALYVLSSIPAFYNRTDSFRYRTNHRVRNIIEAQHSIINHKEERRIETHIPRH